MNPLDFLSDSPNLFILHKETNKTNFGGFLFLIYLVIIIIIFVYYIIDYVINDKYVIQSLSHFNIYTKEKKEERNKNELFNPYINFKLNLLIELNKTKYILDLDEFVLYDNKKSKFNNKDTFFRKRISEFEILLFYDCEEKNCSDYYRFMESLKEMNNNITPSNYILEFIYEGFQLEHQNEDKPILKTEDNDIIFARNYSLNLNYTIKINNQWRNILYTEKKVFFKKIPIIVADILKISIFIFINNNLVN